MVHAVMVTLLPWQHANIVMIALSSHIHTYVHMVIKCAEVFYFCTSIDFDVLLHLYICGYVVISIF